MRRLCALSAAGFLAIAMLGMCGCGKRDDVAGAAPSRASDPVPVTLETSRLQDVQRAVQVIGTLYGDEETTISAKVSGRITNIFKDIGDRLAPGDALAQIDKTDYE